MSTRSRRVRQADRCPARNTACGDVAGCVPVGVLSEAARPAEEGGLVGPVGLGDVSAGGAALRGVGRVDVYDRHPGPCRLVGDVLAELVERPRVQRDPLGPSEPYPVADAAQVFQGDPAAGAFGLGHDALSDAVVGVGGEPGFLAPALLQQPLGGFGADGLEFGTEPLVAVPDPVHGLAAVAYAAGVGGEVGGTEVDAR